MRFFTVERKSSSGARVVRDSPLSCCYVVGCMSMKSRAARSPLFAAMLGAQTTLVTVSQRRVRRRASSAEKLFQHTPSSRAETF